MKAGRYVVWFAVSVLVVGLAVLLVLRQPSAIEEQGPLLKGEFGRAAAVYRRQCSTCHGVEGFGDGKAAYLLHPRPRDFSYGKFLMVSTDNRVPTDEDLFQTISRGLPGSAMPSWERLTEQDRRDLVRYVRALTHRGKVMRLMGVERGPVAAGFESQVAVSEPLNQKDAEETATYLLEVGGPLELPPPAPAQDALLERGRQIYRGNCAKCHGQEGKGDGSEVMEDDLGFRAFPRDFTKGVFKGGVEPEQLAYRILGGMPGSAMPSTDFNSGEDLWAVVHYVRSLIEPGAQQRVEQRVQQLRAARVAEMLSDDPLAGAWDQIQPAYVALMPLWWRDERVEGIDVRAAHDGKNLGIHLTWKDPVEDKEQAHVTTFSDAAAVQFSDQPEPPFFGMGDPAGILNIWHWKAVWEGGRPSDFDISKTYPRAIMDFDMSLKQIHPSAGPDVAAKVEERNPTFYSGWGASNPLSNPERPSPAEDLNAKGMGSLHSQALAGQNVRGKGVWKDGVWRVLFLRPLSASDAGDIDFRPGGKLTAAFAIWDGHGGDRNGQKSVTIWHDLSIAE